MKTYEFTNPFVDIPLEYSNHTPYRKGGRYRAEPKDYIKHKRIIRKIAKHSRQINR